MAPKSISEDQLYSTADAARLRSWSLSAVRSYCAAGLLPAQRVGLRAWLIRGRDLAAFIPPRRGRPRKPATP